AAEARIAARFGYPVAVGSGTPEGAADAANRLLDQGVNALVSFGLAGGLHPAVRPGAILIPVSVQAGDTVYPTDPILAARFGGLTAHRLVAGTAVAAGAAAKQHLYAATQAHAIDLESGGVGRVAHDRGVPFVVVRAISDPAEQDLPPAALQALDGQGRIAVIRVLSSLVHHPSQLPALLRLASGAARARRALLALTRRGLSAPPE
ncbi:MAG TPA: hypothetical protein VGC09_13375, partial [Rhodopila sp.]